MSIHDAPGTITDCHDRERPLKLVTTDAPAAPAEDTPSPEPAETRRRIRLHKLRAALADERMRDTCRLAVRHISYAAGGAKIVTRRAWDGRTAARYERMMRSCEAAGQMEEAKEWEERGQRYRAARHQRRMELLTAPQKTAKAAAASAGLGIGGLLALGAAVAWATGDPAYVLAPTMLVIDLIHWAFIIGTVVWGPMKLAGPALGLVALWRVGQQRQSAPQWALPAKLRSTDGEPITPSIVVKALRDLGIGDLRKAIRAMEDAGASMLSPIAIAGCGVEVDITLPSGVSTEEVMNKRRKLAENLGRHEHEVYITVAPAARTVRVWIADSGALDEPVPASPLVTDPGMTADYKSGRAPWGLDLRGDAVLISLYQKHVLITGLSNQGKTAALRALALWLLLDPTVEFRIGDLKGHGDWRMFQGLATVLIEGPTDGHVADVTEMVEDVFEEMQRRLLAPAGTVFPPLVCIVDEAQVAYGCGAKGPDGRPYGGAKATSRYFKAVKGIHDQGRAVNVTIWEGTQDPTNENLPKRSREGNHIRAALVLGTKSQAEMALGEAPVQKGAAPHKLRQGLDKGQLVAAGEGVPLAVGQVSVNVRTHFIDGDAAKEIADRARELRSRVTTLARPEAVEHLDPLADIACAVADVPRLRTQVVLQRLAERNPAAYRDWTFQDLKEVLEGVGAAPHKSDGQMVVDREKVQRALARRDSDDQGGAREAGSSP